MSQEGTSGTDPSADAAHAKRLLLDRAFELSLPLPVLSETDSDITRVRSWSAFLGKISGAFDWERYADADQMWTLQMAVHGAPSGYLPAAWPARRHERLEGRGLDPNNVNSWRELALGDLALLGLVRLKEPERYPKRTQEMIEAHAELFRSRAVTEDTYIRVLGPISKRLLTAYQDSRLNWAQREDLRREAQRIGLRSEPDMDHTALESIIENHYFGLAMSQLGYEAGQLQTDQSARRACQNRAFSLRYNIDFPAPERYIRIEHSKRLVPILVRESLGLPISAPPAETSLRRAGLEMGLNPRRVTTADIATVARVVNGLLGDVVAKALEQLARRQT